MQRADEEYLAVCRHLGDYASVCTGLFNLSNTLCGRGDVPGARAAARELEQLARKFDLAHSVASGKLAEGRAWVADRDPRAAREALHAARELAGRGGFHDVERGVRQEMLLVLVQEGEARPLLEELDRAEAVGETPWENPVDASLLRAWALERLEAFDQAAGWVERADTDAATLGRPRLRAHVALARARAARREGRTEEVARQEARAKELLDRIGLLPRAREREGWP